jgi:hypothetical protein
MKNLLRVRAGPSLWSRSITEREVSPKPYSGKSLSKISTGRSHDSGPSFALGTRT